MNNYHQSVNEGKLLRFLKSTFVQNHSNLTVFSTEFLCSLLQYRQSSLGQNTK